MPIFATPVPNKGLHSNALAAHRAVLPAPWIALRGFAQLIYAIASMRIAHPCRCSGVLCIALPVLRTWFRGQAAPVRWAALLCSASPVRSRAGGCCANAGRAIQSRRGAGAAYVRFAGARRSSATRRLALPCRSLAKLRYAMPTPGKGSLAKPCNAAALLSSGTQCRCLAMGSRGDALPVPSSVRPGNAVPVLCSA